ncbi:MAG TPA: DNA polymerase/3'-5' exonuclease PolX [Ideonella sp.]|uniref:DNA polymerase/3'-5' exonuclease PolX n=1 Tax=Ideonella sp. TaxID=1929293 RepID=UPI002E335122|nr:DNA polymerase/3'-5' exonuclease PolX [Ideonella sp.]HEX5687387.1 DNA polymerase/3'-5' exonuclease PolX [Ideonella sp.]
MTMRNAEVAAVFDQIADLLEIGDENPFRVRAYRNAARMLGQLRRSVEAMVQAGEDLDELPGIGPDLAGKIAEIVHTGRCALLDQLHRKTPPAVCELLQLPGLGPKRVRLLHDDLGVDSVADLHRAAQDGRICDVPGFGEKTQARILEATARHLRAPRRFMHVVAQSVADDLVGFLHAVPGVEQALAAGSYRRGRETVGDLDLLVAARADSPAMLRFVEHPEVKERLLQGPTRASVVLRNGMQVDLRAVPPESFGAAAVYFTGSKAHNIALRRLAQTKGLKINEYGVYRGAERIAGDTEESLYRAIGLDPVPPELREDRGEIEAARQGKLPQLVRLQDLRGDLHSHTRDSDGHDTMEAMVEAARGCGLRYLAITEHSRRLGVARGLDPVRLAKQIDRIDGLNETLADFTVLKGIEVDILEDGSLDLPDSILSRLDLVVGAVHHRFDLSRAKQTARLMRAMDQRCFSILAHPTGRLIGERPPMEVDLLRLVRHAKQRGCFLELNAQPSRLDLDDVACQMTKAEGVLVSIASDAHSGVELDNLASGVQQARRGWLEPADVLNTRPLDELRALLRRTT